MWYFVVEMDGSRYLFIAMMVSLGYIEKLLLLTTFFHFYLVGLKHDIWRNWTGSYQVEVWVALEEWCYGMFGISFFGFVLTI